MPLEPLLAGYAGLACLALAMKRHRSIPPASLVPAPWTARSIGTGLLVVSFALAMMRLGPTLGPVAWIGQLCLAGAGLVLLMSWKPRVALALAVPAVGLAFVL